MIFPETGLSELEIAEGWILSCVRAVETDVTLEVDDPLEVVLPPIRVLPCRISHLEYLASDVVQVKLRLPPAADFGFLPGQHIEVIGPNGIRRCYSLANASFDGGLLELHIRAVRGGTMSDYWFRKAKPNDLLRLKGPLGTFFLRETADVDIFFLATGTGIAPVKSILESLGQCPPNQRPSSISVFWGCRNSRDFYLNLDEIDCAFSYTLVQSQPLIGWTGAKGYVQDVMLSAAPSLKNAVVYACGSDDMIRSAKTGLMCAGLQANNFHADAFISSGVSLPACALHTKGA